MDYEHEDESDSATIRTVLMPLCSSLNYFQLEVRLLLVLS